jgi:predicted nuclease of predicted toxin-antitoxin system
MKFLLDAQLPIRLSNLLKSMGHDAIHTKELNLKNATPDTEINTISLRDLQAEIASFDPDDDEIQS